jgi:serine protease
MILRLWIYCLLLSSSLFAAVPAGMEKATREVIIKWRHMPSALDAADLLPQFAPQTEAISATLPATGRTDQGLERVSTLTATSVEAAHDIVAALQNDPRVEYAELRPIRHTDEFEGNRRGGNALDGVPNDPFYAQQWGLQAVDAEAAWNITRGDSNTIIAVVDIGVDFAHPELTPQRWTNWAEVHGTPGVDDDGNGYVDDYYGYDFVDGDGDPTPNPLVPAESHGTHVSGIAAAVRNNGRGIAGLAPECRIMGVRAGNGGNISYGYDGIYYACRSGAKIINCSWGGPGESGFEKDVLNYVLSQGCVVVAAAGNSRSSVPDFPAGYEGVMSVAASGPGDVAADFTSYGPWVKVSAPGVFILSTIIGEDGGPAYDWYQGTSMSSPYAAATCALVASRYPGLDGRQIMARVLASSDPIDGINPTQAGSLGIGRVNAWRALTDSVAGVRLVSVGYEELSPDHDGRIRGGETARLKITIQNDLGPLVNVVGSVADTSHTISILNSGFGFSSVPSGIPVENDSVIIQVANGTARGPIIPFTFDFNSNGRLIGRATATVYLDSTFVVADNGKLKLGFAENGCLGYYDYVQNLYIGPGWTVGDHSNALFHGSFLVASDGAVSDNAYGNAPDSLPDFYDWAAVPDSVAHAITSSRADYEARASFEDSHAPHELFARVDAAAMGWYGSDANGSLVLEYHLTNRSLNSWNNSYVGFFLDIDLASADGNVAAYDTVSGIVYVRQIRPTHPLAGVVPLNGDRWGSLYVVDNRAQIDPPTWGDSTKWSLLTQGIGPIPTQPMDLSLMLAVGPLNMDAHASRTFAYAFVVGQTIEDLRAQANAAQQHYMPRQAPPPSSPERKNGARAKLVPNPLTQGEALRLLTPDAQPVDVKIYNILGQTVAQWRGLQSGPQGIALDPGMLNGASGLLFYRIESASARTTGKLLILK